MVSASSQLGDSLLKKLSASHRRRADVCRRRIELEQSRRKIRRRERRLKRTFEVDRRRAFATRNKVPIDPRLDRAQIIMPKAFSLTTNYDETINVISKMRSHCLQDRRPVMLHFTTVEVIEPAAALVLVAEIDRLRSLRGHAAVTGTYPNNHAIYELLCDMGFYSLLKVVEIVQRPRANDDPSQPVFLRFLSENRVPAEQVDRFVGIIEKHIFSLNHLARERLVAAIIEAMANTLDHSHPFPSAGETMRNRWWLTSRINVAANEVTIVIFDQGVGIPKTLGATAYESIRAALANASKFRLTAQPSDGEMILAATEYHRSGTGAKGRGRGFADMKRFVDVCTDGELRVLSNKGSYHYVSGAEGYDNARTSLGGTLIEWRFRHDGVVEMSDG
jgi:hypothetical protein